MGCGSSAQPDAQSPAEKDATLSGQTSNPKSDLRLFEASEKGSTNEVRLLLAAAANPNWQNPEWVTAHQVSATWCTEQLRL